MEPREIGKFLVIGLNIVEFAPRLGSWPEDMDEVRVHCVSVDLQRTMEFTTSIAFSKDLFLGKEIVAYFEETENGQKISFFSPKPEKTVQTV